MGEAAAVQSVQERTPAMAAQENDKIDVSSRIEQRLAEDEEATVEIPAEKNSLHGIENACAADIDDNSEDAASAAEMQPDATEDAGVETGRDRGSGRNHFE